MIPRKELTDLLESRLQGVLPRQSLDGLIEEVLSLEKGWEELQVSHRDMGYSMSVLCTDICWLAEQIEKGAVIKMFRKKPAAA